ncbi:polyisoprenoid-binding protein [Corynebacterium atypicum]|uniref:Polyisoprenoid-binding protein n=1 Tax=Corynebacterium atypicum TaxID=191610 RepID=A0ABM5QNJ0_9CORY|nr:YceI family protein [Corynebacterium atypicum]AIG64334.1 polyisoprenoid-binding protein [Corynebacterium atypicum]
MTDFSGNYAIDPAHTLIGFSVRHAMVTKVRGRFDDFEGSVEISAADGSAGKAQATIKATSVDTNDSDRDNHVRSADFFDVENYPEITFTSTEVSIEGGEGTVTGDLTIKGTTKPVTLDVELVGVEEDPFGNTRLGFEAKGTINRTDFGVDFQAPLKSGGMLVGEKITLEIEGSVIKQ